MSMRCKDCIRYLKGTIAKPGCGKTGLIVHPLNRICKDFRPKPTPIKKELRMKPLTEVP